MAGAVKPLYFRFRDHRTGEMRALLAVRNELPFIDAHEQGRITRTWIMKKFGSSHRKLIHASDVLKRRLPASPPQSAQEHNPRLANEESETCNHHEFREIAAGAIIVLRRINRELLAPVRLLRSGSIIRRDDFRACHFHSPSPQRRFRPAKGCLRVGCRRWARRVRQARQDALPSNAQAPSYSLSS